MGKIVAIGGGFGGAANERLTQHLMDLTGKEHPHVLELPTAGFDNFERGILETFYNRGCTVDTLFLSHAYVTEEMIAQKVGEADIIYATGGNLKYLADVWKKTKADVYLKQAYERGTVLCGTSSGAMCWFAEGYDDCGPAHEFMFVECLGLLPYVNCPHFESGSWQSFAKRVRERSLSGIACENEAAICFVDGKKYILTGSREGCCHYFDAKNNFKAYNLAKHMELLD